MKLKLPNSLLGLLFLLWSMIVWADVTFDNSTVVPVGVRNTTLTGNMTIPASSGKQLGGNLFHSFSAFNINTGQSVTFNNTGNIGAISNVLSRVTGNTASNIDGLLKSTIPNANVYLINPNGITFGSHASINVLGAFHASTANSINLSDGNQFNASKVGDALLTSSAPAAFGFLGNSSANNGNINNGAITVNGAQLDAAGKTLDLAAGKIEIKTNAKLESPAGEIRLVALEGSGSVSVQLDSGKTPLPTATPSASNAGDISITTGSTVKSDGNTGGRVALWGDTVKFDNGKVTALNTGASAAGSAQGIEIRANNLDLANQSAIKAEANNSGKAVNINVTATDVKIDNSSITSKAINNSTGDAGDISVTIDSMNIQKGGNISSSTDAQGKAGKVTVTATNKITIDGQNSAALTGIYSDALEHSHGQAGIVEISTDTLEIKNAGAVGSNTLASGDAGNVTVSANTLKIDGQNYSGFTGITSSGSSGNAGTITVTPKNGSLDLDIVNGGSISSSTFGVGHAGAINITSSTLTIDRQNSQSLTNISSEAKDGSTGNAGAITINTDTLDLLNNGVISTNTFGAGHGGNIAVTATDLSITGKDSTPFDESLQTGIISQATHSSSGDAGTINVEADTLTILSTGKISSDTQSSGDGGDISITAQNIYLDGQTSKQKTLIASDALTGSSGKAGTVTVHAKTLGLTNNAQISSDTYSNAAGVSGQAGQLVITASDSITLNNGGLIGSSSFNNGLGGSITLTTPLLTLDNNSLIAASSTSQASSGDISLIVPGISILNSSSITASNTGSGAAGKIDISTNTQSLTLKNNGSISVAISETDQQGGSGNAGEITIKTSTLNIESASKISSNTDAHGNAGHVSVIADTLTIDGQNNTAITGIVSDALKHSYGKAGTVAVNTRILDISNNGQISSDTASSGDAGNVTVIASQSLVAANAAKITSSTYGSGKAGDVIVTTPMLSLDTGAEISALAGIGSQGQTGQIQITADTITLANAGKISVQNDGIATDPTTKTAKDLVIAAPHLSLSGGVITAATSGNVNAGNVIVTTPNTLLMSAGASVNSNTSGIGNAGNVSVTAPSISLDNASITAKTTASGNAGSVTVTVNNTLTAANNASINSSTSASGNAGNVAVSAADVAMNKASIKATAETGSSGIAGSVAVNATHALDATNFASINSSTYGSGKAGDVTVTTPILSLDNNAEISALAGVGSQGQTGLIQITADTITLANVGKISVQNDGIATDPATKTAKDLVIAAPHLSLNGGVITAATSGNVNAGNVTVSTTNSLSMTASASINSNTSGSGNAGNVSVTAPSISLDNASITAKTTASGNAGSVTVTVNNTLTTANNASINSSTSASGNAGNVTVSGTDVSMNKASIKATAETGSSGIAGSVTVNASHTLDATNFASINSSTYGSGKAGDVTVTAPTLSLDNNAEISALAGVGSQGQTGLIQITADTITLANAGKISVQNDGIATDPTTKIAKDLVIAAPHLSLNGGVITAATSGNVNAGNVIVTTPNTLLMNADASVNSNTSGSGNAGNVSVTAPSISLDNASISAKTTASGNGGSVIVTADNTLTATDNASINSSTTSSGDAGNVTVSATDVSMDNANIKATAETGSSGMAGSVTVNATQTLTATHSASVSTSTLGSGNAGEVTIKTNTLDIINGGQIASDTFSSGNAGDINITADTLKIDGKNSQNITGITSNANLDSIGDAGTVTVSSHSLTISNKGQISSNTYSSGDAGNINITASERTSLNNGTIGSSSYGNGIGGSVSLISPLLTLDNASTIAASSSTEAKGGDISISSNVLKLQNQSLIDAVNTGSGEAGTINIIASDSMFLTDSKITVESAQGNAGDINIFAHYKLYLLNSEITTSAAGGKGNGGNITIDPVFVVLNQSNIIANATQGSGGNIDITTNFFLASTNSTIQASSQFGLQGTVSINSSNSNIAGSIGVLSTDFTDASNLMDKQCGSSDEQARSSFTASSLHGLVLPGPDSFLDYVPASMSGCGT